MNIQKAIAVANKSTFMLVAHPVEDAYMYGVEVTPVHKGNEIHFVLRKSDGSDDEPIIEGHEGAVCLQVLRAFGENADGMQISDIHFYARYADAWHHISFNEFDANKVKKSWPECGSGKALGVPFVETMAVSDLKKLPVINDYSAHPFFYWWHTVEATNQVIRKYEDELRDALRSVERNVPFGDITYEATEKRTYKCIFARHKKVAIERLKTICDANEVFYQTSIEKVKDRKGWAVVVVHFDRLEVSHHIYEPGKHELDEFDFKDLREMLSDAGGLIKELSDDSWSVSLSTEIDLSKIERQMRPFALFKRGDYQFTMSKKRITRISRSNEEKIA